ncbi:hypothetical protein BACERE00184_00014 [Bacillus cereus]|jgi:hypothetical protein|nr:hypothetical protein BACERE00184_00014 [Bacillus cereus]
MNLDEIFNFIVYMSPLICIVVVLFAYARMLERKGE